MVTRRRPNREAIQKAKARLAVARFIMEIFLEDRRGSDFPSLEERAVYYVVLVGTLTRKTMGVTKIAGATSLDPKTARKWATKMVERGVFLQLSDRTYIVDAKFANHSSRLRRVEVYKKMVRELAKNVDEDPR